jgi:ubiquinone/menaquinone biosynthesis C-methylase UbiE
LTAGDLVDTRREVAEQCGHPWFAAVLDLGMRWLEPIRVLVVPEARGSVLEVGIGTGLNVPLYGEIDELIGVDPDPYMLARAQNRVRSTDPAFPVELHLTSADPLPFEEGRFDTVVVTFTLCTIPDPVAALAEVRRVLRPGGRLLFVEHARAVQPAVAFVQDALTPLWRRLFGGCRLNRPAVELVRGSGLVLEEWTSVWGERWTLMPVYRGMASATG